MGVLGEVGRDVKSYQGEVTLENWSKVPPNKVMKNYQLIFIIAKC